MSALEDFVAAPTKLNVFYRGLENPLEISVPGITGDMLNVSIDGNHSIKKLSDGNYVVTPSQNGASRANITVIAELPDGSSKVLPAKNFRVLEIPSAIARWGKRTSLDDEISTSEMLEFAPLSASLVDFGFDLVPEVKSFVMYISKDGTFTRYYSNTNEIVYYRPGCSS